jgi:hypothetical protein
LTIAGFVLAAVASTTTRAAPPGTNVCPDQFSLVHVSGPPGDDSRKADRNDDGYVCRKSSGNGEFHYTDNNQDPS